MVRRLVWSGGVVLILSGCGGGGGDQGAPQDGGTGGPAPPTNSAPAISGSPPSSVGEGELYRFQPDASDPDGDPLTFGITNPPPWAVFDSATGELAGTPATSDVGTYADIVISVDDGEATTQLPPFSITVEASLPASLFELRRPNVFVALEFGSGGRYFRPEGVASLDANDDGLPDLLHAPSFFNVEPELPLQIFLNQGGGRFMESADSIIHMVPTIGYIDHPTIVVDFNGDGADDAFLVDSGLEIGDPSTFPLGQPKLLLSNGSGGLNNATTTHLPAIREFNHNASAGDVDNDGDLDILVVSLSETRVYMLVNDGSGRFELRTDIFPDTVLSFLGNEFDAGAVHLSDVDGDGRLDAILGSYFNASAEKAVAFSLQADNGRFGELEQVPIRDDLSGGGIDQILSEDFDMDGDPDVIVKVDGSIAIAGEDSEIGLMALRNDGGDFVDVTEEWVGAARFIEFLPDNRVAGLEVHDFNGDGVPDLGFAHARIPLEQLGRFLLINDGTGRFSPMTGADVPEPLGIVPFYLDHDADGDLDIVGMVPEITEAAPDEFVQGGYEIVVVEQTRSADGAASSGDEEGNAPPTNEAPTITNLSAPITVLDNEVIDISASASDPEGELVSIRFEQSSGPPAELVATEPGKSTWRMPVVYAPTNLSFGVSASDPAGAAAEEGVLITVSPKTHAGRRQLSGTATEHFQTEYYQVFNFGFDARATAASYEEVCYPTSDDCTGPGMFSFEMDESAVGDFNGDGFEDAIIHWMYFPHTIPRADDMRSIPQIYLNDGEGRLVKDDTVYLEGRPPERHFLYRMGIADFNGDGLDDYLGGAFGLNQRLPEGGFNVVHEPILLMLSDGQGRLFDATTRIEGQEGYEPGPTWVGPHDLAWGDVDGDADVDFFAGEHLFLNNGTGYFTDTTHVLPDLSVEGVASSVISDFNNDGIGDIAWFQFQGFDGPDGRLWLSTGQSPLTDRTVLELPSAFFGDTNTANNHAAAADLDGDGLKDIVIGQTRAEPYYVGRAIQILMNYGDGDFRDETDARMGFQWRSTLDTESGPSGEGYLILRDINVDGYVDIVDSNNETHARNVQGTTIYLNDGKGVFHEVNMTGVAWVERYQLAGFEHYEEFLPGRIGQTLAIDIDNRAGIDFVAAVYTPLDELDDPREQTLYQIMSREPLPTP